MATTQHQHVVIIHFPFKNSRLNTGAEDQPLRFYLLLEKDQELNHFLPRFLLYQSKLNEKTEFVLVESTAKESNQVTDIFFFFTSFFKINRKFFRLKTGENIESHLIALDLELKLSSALLLPKLASTPKSAKD